MGDLRLGETWTLPQRVKNDMLYALGVASLTAARRVSHQRRLALGRVLGRVVEATWASGRQRAAERLRAAYAGTPPVSTRAVFEAMGEDLAWTLALLDPSVRASQFLPMSRQAVEVLERARSGGRGVVFVSAHLGPMELVAACVAEQGFVVSTLARASYDPRFTSLYERVRAPRGVRTIYRGSLGADVAVIRALRRGEVVGFPMDLAGRGMAVVPCHFLGEDARVPIGPARIALLTGAAVVAGTVAPSRAGGLELTAELVSTEGLERGEPGVALTERLAHVLERRIRELPSHWPWMHGASDATLPGRCVSR